MIFVPFVILSEVSQSETQSKNLSLEFSRTLAGVTDSSTALGMTKRFALSLVPNPVRAAHPDLYAGGIVCADALGAAPPLSRRAKQIVRRDFDLDWRLFPGLVPHSEKTTASALAGESRVTLQQKLSLRSDFTRIKAGGRDRRAILKPTFVAQTVPSISPSSWRVRVAEMPEPVR